MKLKLSIIGCGRLGKTLAYLLAKTEWIAIQDIVNLSDASAKNAVAFIGQGRVCSSFSQLRSADIYLIATPDDYIADVCQQLAEQALLKQGNIVFHCSGLYSSEHLSAATDLGCHTASLHPIFSFSNPVVNIKTFKGTYCAIEGDKFALEKLLLLFRAIGGQLFLIAKEDKAFYHIASVFASNYLVTLSTIAETCYKKAGLTTDLAKRLTETLMMQTLNNMKSLKQSKKVLTGPLQRGDQGALKKHLNTLKRFPELESTYKNLAKVTLTLTKHNKSLKAAISNLFYN